MKKCPKCGTVLDDSKKKCYMCGADLTASTSVSDFSSSFDNKIGSSITRGIDNVFNNGKDINVDSSDIIGEKKNNNGSFFSHNSSSRDFFGGEINKLNSMTYDDRSQSKKKINNLFGKNELKSKDEINSKQKKKRPDKNDGKVKKISYSTNPNIPKKMQEAIEEKKKEPKVRSSNNMFFPENENSKVIKSDLVKKPDNDDIPDAFKTFNSFKDKGNDNKKMEMPSQSNKNSFAPNFELKKDNHSNSKLSKEKVNSAFAMFNSNKKEFYNNDNDVKVDFYDDKKDSTKNQINFKGFKEPKPSVFEGIGNKMFNRMNTAQLKETGRIIFNFACVVCFVALLVFVYFRFIKIDATEQLDGLQYKVPSYFKLNRTDTHEKFYVSKEQGNVCSFEVLSGTVSDPNGYVENYFQYLKNMYASDEKAVPTLQEMKINGNTWKSEKFIYLPEDGKEVSSENIIPRYAYTIITYNGSFYVVRSSNKDETKECDEQLMKFMNSLEFIEVNVK